MNWNEKGVLPTSRIYFFQPMATTVLGNYHISCVGSFECNADYCVARAGYYSPLFIFIVEGSLRVTVEHTATMAYANQIVLIDCQSAHRYEAVEHCVFSFFHFDGSNATHVVQQLIRRNGGSPVFISSENEWFDIRMSLLLVHLKNSDYPDEHELSGFVYTILGKMQSLGSPQSSAPQANTVLVVQAQKYILSHLTQNLSRTELAGALNISVDYLSHLFQKETGYSPIEYHARQRIEFAKSVLLYSDAGIAEIGETMGFSSAASFINAFRARTNMTPLQYRHRHMKQ